MCVVNWNTAVIPIIMKNVLLDMVQKQGNIYPRVEM